MGNKKTWLLKRVKQCRKCPWKQSVSPREIPNGYSEEKHVGLKKTIAIEGDLSGLNSPTMNVMACHETQDAHCIGWLVNQLGPGNNIPLRFHIRNCENVGEIETFGPQHENFEDTLPSN